MADIDLIPRQYHLRRQLSRRLRRFTVALVVTLCVLGGARAVLGIATSHEHREIAKLRKMQLDAAREAARVTEFEQQKLAVEKQLRSLDDLRGRERTGHLLRALDQAYLTGVWFDEISSGSMSAAALPGVQSAVAARAGLLVLAPPAATPAPAIAAHPAAAPGEQNVELTGHAVDHSLLASFMTRLAAQPAVVSVQLLDTSSRLYSTASVVDFKVSLTIDEKRLP